MQNLLSRTLGETIQLECRFAPNLPRVLADESNLDQIIMNLAVNARDAMPNGGKLSISTAEACSRGFWAVHPTLMRARTCYTTAERLTERPKEI